MNSDTFLGIKSTAIQTFFLLSTLLVIGTQVVDNYLNFEENNSISNNSLISSSYFYQVMIPVKIISAIYGLYNKNKQFPFLYGVNMFLGLTVYILGVSQKLLDQYKNAFWFAIFGDMFYYSWYTYQSIVVKDFYITFLTITSIIIHTVLVVTNN